VLWIVWGFHDGAHALMLLQICLAILNIKAERIAPRKPKRFLSLQIYVENFTSVCGYGKTSSGSKSFSILNMESRNTSTVKGDL
jgi:hypothetical protein